MGRGRGEGGGESKWRWDTDRNDFNFCLYWETQKLKTMKMYAYILEPKLLKFEPVKITT